MPRRFFILLALLPVLLLLSSGATAETDPVIRVVYNNIVDDQVLEGDWGFSCVIEGLEKTVLFDTGTKGDILMNNMKEMGIDPGSIDIIVLSHFHMDHIGGLSHFLEMNTEAMIFAPASFPDGWKTTLREKGIRLIDVKGPMAICEDAFTTGEMGSQIVEQSLVIRTTRGSLLITGCAHPGIVQIVEKATDLSGKQVFFAMGGFHLLQHGEEAIADILEDLYELGVVYCGASHCTGDAQTGSIKEAFGHRYVDSGAGAVIDTRKFEWRPSGASQSAAPDREAGGNAD